MCIPTRSTTRSRLCFRQYQKSHCIKDETREIRSINRHKPKLKPNLTSSNRRDGTRGLIDRFNIRILHKKGT